MIILYKVAVTMVVYLLSIYIVDRCCWHRSWDLLYDNSTATIPVLLFPLGAFIAFVWLKG